MKAKRLVACCVFFFIILSMETAVGYEVKWQAQWITASQNQNESDTWICFRKDFEIETPPASAITHIAADSKYWLWINGNMVVFVGGLKRGPNPNDSYYDDIDIARFIHKGKNTIAVLVWYFGKDGFSHKSSGKAGLMFQCITPELKIVSDNTWMAAIHPAYEHTQGEKPNYRLSESNVRFDARRDIPNWRNTDHNLAAYGFGSATEMGMPPVSPWNNLIRRLIPQWKNSGPKEYTKITITKGDVVDTIVCQLPYNAQITPYLKIESAEGKTITILTDNYYGGGPANVRAEYVTRSGVQAYEGLGWMNGHKVIYIIPNGVKLMELRYRETGYNTGFAGSFTCSDPFLNKLWEKAQRTLYITMRDNYMDCPDRERAQWIGDAVNESGGAFYALGPESALLQRKGMYELIGWQRADSTLFAPIPAGNWNKELPSQVLSAIGYYGFWNYYLNTGDIQPIADLYDGVITYLNIWKINDKGTVAFRAGEWSWGDWGDNIDIDLMYNPLYYLALKGVRNMALTLGKTSDAEDIEHQMIKFKECFNNQFWTGKEYRSTDYKGRTDDRCQALAVVSGLANSEKYSAILEILKNEEHASPYMEKYVMEALFMMGYEDYAIERTKRRFETMVNHPEYSTLFEGWDIGTRGFGGGTINHAWSGGALTVLSQYLCGISPVDPGYSTFSIMPRPGSILYGTAKMESVKGVIESSFINEKGKFKLHAVVPQSTSAIIGIPDKGFSKIIANGKLLWDKGRYVKGSGAIPVTDGYEGFVAFKVPSGVWSFKAE